MVTVRNAAQLVAGMPVEWHSHAKSGGRRLGLKPSRLRAPARDYSIGSCHEKLQQHQHSSTNSSTGWHFKIEGKEGISKQRETRAMQGKEEGGRTTNAAGKATSTSWHFNSMLTEWGRRLMQVTEEERGEEDYRCSRQGRRA